MRTKWVITDISGNKLEGRAYDTKSEALVSMTPEELKWYDVEEVVIDDE